MTTCYYCPRPPYYRHGGVPVCEDHVPQRTEERKTDPAPAPDEDTPNLLGFPRYSL